MSCSYPTSWDQKMRPFLRNNCNREVNYIAGFFCPFKLLTCLPWWQMLHALINVFNTGCMAPFQSAVCHMLTHTLPIDRKYLRFWFEMPKSRYQYAFSYPFVRHALITNFFLSFAYAHHCPEAGSSCKYHVSHGHMGKITRTKQCKFR